MFHYKQIIERLRAGETEREISRSRFMGRQKVAKIRVLAKALGWLDTAVPRQSLKKVCAFLPLRPSAKSYTTACTGASVVVVTAR